MSTYEIILTLAERFGLLVGGVFLVMIFTPAQRIGFTHGQSRMRTLLLMLFFGICGILGTYTGNSVFGSVANLRAMVVITGGLFGGPVVGFGSGLIAGAHRILTDLNGFSAWPCGISTAIEGLAAGGISLWYASRAMNWKIGAGLALLGEALHMVLILILSKPFDEAVALVKLIAPPMIIINTVGAALFVEIINIFSRDRERRDSVHAQKILDIANHTVSYLRSGLTLDSAEAMATIIRDRVGVAAVAVTDTRNVLAHIGAGDDHHLPGREIRTRATREVLRDGVSLYLRTRSRIRCVNQDCPMTSAIIVPLTKNGEIVGTLKFYGTREIPLNTTLFELAKGLGNLFSTQLELEDIQIKEQMLAHAEIRRLQSQINPHFLFNSLNTITSFCRTNSEKARDLLKDLSSYMRRNLDLSRGFIPLSEELDQVRSYLAIETARFGDRISVEMDIAPECEEWPIPPLILQPLVENSVRHGLLSQENGGTITIRARCTNKHLELTVADNGAGMSRKTVESLFTKNCVESRTQGIGVRNCLNRLEQIYGPSYTLNIRSEQEHGTSIDFRVPTMPKAAGAAPRSA
ncbi:LytS/YhcK type 5TM receptor domain-containing protein [Pseudodesulfovibrio tunisiensis]|uniref:LytS/YhcK type 5TM receptor domain-containing protein n=1 Tax=Pseudodesulfovibrio tunisiensis TaxID=463192 RepID=UPI001FB1D724|nr:LytS/YhcK type 5TM receptor domain-containing protein [Pseudodesulfovibrio tunisiensis]